MNLMNLLGGLLFLFTSLNASAEIKVGLLLDKGGKDDKSFNSAAFAGAAKAEKELGIKLKVVEATDDNAFQPLIRSFAQKDFDLIICIGFAQADPLNKVAPQFPQKKFAIVDSEVHLPNVRSLMFEEHEGSFIVGAIAAMMSKTGQVGFVGGMDIPLIRRFQMGYEAGGRHVNPKIKVISNYIGVTGDSWNNPAKGKELALAQYQTKTDIIFSAAGASNAGVFDAAEDKKLFAIGVDSNQNWVKPGLILTSMLKRVDEAVYSVIQETRTGKFSSGTKRYGLANKGIDYAVDQYNEKILPAAIRKKADDLKKQIISGKIVVPDFYKIKK